MSGPVVTAQDQPDQTAVRALLDALEGKAAATEQTVLRLKAGISQSEGLGLFRKSGFAEVGPYAAYKQDPPNTCMEKHLNPRMARERLGNE